MQLLVTNSPFNEEQTELLNRLLPQLTESQRLWLSGYLTAYGSLAAFAAAPSGTPAQTPGLPAAPAASATGAASLAAPVSAPQPVSNEVTVLYGSQTGNAQRLAKSFSEKLKQHGFQVELSSMSDYKTNQLKKVRNLFILVSTHGEGDPPDSAISFYEFLHGKKAPKLEETRFSVLSLGDSSYEFFCKTGKDFDKRLEELGAQRLAPRVDCDVDYDEPAAEWMEQAIQALLGASQSSAVPEAAAALAGAAVLPQVSVPAGGAAAVATVAAVAGAATAVVEKAAPAYSRTNPFQAEVLENLNLNGRGSTQETHHLELSLEGSGFQFEPGDCLGIFPQNHPELVDELIAELGWNPEQLVAVNKQGEERPIRDALLNQFEITVLTKPIVEQLAQLSGNSGLKELFAPGKEQRFREYANGRDLLDLVRDYSLRGLPASDLIPLLRKIPARLYSIASSQLAYPDEAHLTIRTVRYESHGRTRYGVCSSQIADRVQPGDTLPVYVHHNPNFKLPSDSGTPIIMIGPGTGVAPFRAFLQEREEIGADGKAWLFFGDRNFLTDFLYQVEWQRWLKDGVLTRMDVAFSRDRKEKVYVQHRMLEKSRELFRWLEDGASVYVCGDEKHMAHDVHKALLTIIAREGGLNEEAAEAYLSDMQKQKRYQRDVY